MAAKNETGNQKNGRVTIGKSNAVQQFGTVTAPFRGEIEFGDGPEPVTWLWPTDLQRPGGWKGNHTGEDGSRRPSIAHRDGDYKTRIEHPRARSRYRMMVNHHGNEVAVLHSNGASHLPTIEPGSRYSRDEWCQHMIDKAITLGWFVTDECLLRQIKAKRIGYLAAGDQLRKAKVCKPGATSCPHREIEREARLAITKQANDVATARYTAQDPSVAMAAAIAKVLDDRAKVK